jgi:three-Cys-motif partner protein
MEENMVALRRPADLPEPEDDGLPYRSIKTHTHEKLHYWGNYLWAASSATSKEFPGARVCADLFAGHGICHDTTADRFVWGSALLALQMPAPFDLYVFNDLHAEATAALAARVRRLGIAGAVVEELDLREEGWQQKARQIRNVVAPWGPKVVITTGEANKAHWAVKELEPQGRHYLCAVIDPQSAIYEWESLESLAYGEKAMDVLMLFPDEMDISRALEYYLDHPEKLDRCFGTAKWRQHALENPDRVASALRELYEERMRSRLGFLTGRPQTVSIATRKRALYRLIFASRKPLGINIWNSVCSHRPDEQYELPIF